MKININKIQSLIKKNFEIYLLLIIILFSVTSIQFYNTLKTQKRDNLSSILNNIYFDKTLNNLFNSVNPKFHNIEHQILAGETLSSILKN